MRMELHMLLATAVVAGVLAVRNTPDPDTACTAFARDGSSRPTAPVTAWLDAYLAGAAHEVAPERAPQDADALAASVLADCTDWPDDTLADVAARIARRRATLASLQAARAGDDRGAAHGAAAARQ